MNRNLPKETEMERATYGRDPSYDGIFFVCVKTTGIFCRPSCSARKPRKQNVLYRASVRDCLLDGFRPCKRCRPLAAGNGESQWLDGVLARFETSPGQRITDKELQSLGVSPHWARRYFRRNFGMTFQAYHRAQRMGLALEQLRRGEDSLAVGFDQSYESASGFRDAFKRVFGLPPGQSDAVVAIHTVRLDTPVGPLVAGATDKGVCLLEFADRRAFQRQVATLQRLLRGVVIPGRNQHLDRLAGQLSEYFDGQRQSFSVPLVTPGTEFQQRVWGALRRIPFGQTISYAELARRMGRSGAQRAVGRANGDNRIAILIPCHRVVKDDGTLCGYGGGLWRKKHLLDLERTAGSSGDRPLDGTNRGLSGVTDESPKSLRTPRGG